MSRTRHRKANSLVYGSLMTVTLLAGTAPAAMNYFVDPFEFFRTGQHSKIRKEQAEKSHYPLWKFAHYDRKAELVVLGDSRARALRDKYWMEFGSAPAFNFAYGGGTVPEIYSTFQAIKNDPKVKTLVVGIQLRSFDERHKGGLNRVPEAQKATTSRVSYLKNWFVARQSWKFFQSDNPKLVQRVQGLLSNVSLDAQAADLGPVGRTEVKTLLLPDVCFGCELPSSNAMVEPPRTKGPNLGLGRGNRHLWNSNVSLQSLQPLPEKFDRQVRKNAKSDWRGFRFSERYFNMLVEMSKWADARTDRQLVFVIPPTIVEMQATISAFGLAELNKSFRQKLAKLAPVVDLDFPSGLTRNVNHFSDAYHFDSKVARQIVGQIMTAAGATEDQQKRIAKKHTEILCPSPHHQIELEPSDGYFEGHACRVWERKKDV